MLKSALLILTVAYAVPIAHLVWHGIRQVAALVVKPKDFAPQLFWTAQELKGGRKLLLLCGSVLAEIEYVLSPIRHYLVGWPLIGFVAYRVAALAYAGEALSFTADSVWLAGLCGVQVWARSRRNAALLRGAEYLREHPQAHPGDFFTLLKFDLAFGVPELFSYRLRETPPNGADFRGKGRPRQTIWILAGALVDTVYTANLVLVAIQKMGSHYAREIADPAASMWGKRMLQRSQNQLLLQGAEKLAGLKGRFLLIFNHKSALDFVLTFFALSGVALSDRNMRPRFIVAKDHFRDNPLLYRILGIGRVCEAMDMIFIERKDRRHSRQNLKQAAQFLVKKNVDIAIYPQGTRAIGNFDRAGKRRDAGYYTTVSSKDPLKPLSHLKKGTAHLIFDSLTAMRNDGLEESLHLVFVGIKGTANTLPRGSFKVQTDNQLLYNVGEVVSLVPGLVADFSQTAIGNEEESANLRQLFIERMNQLIDERLRDAVGLHPSLKKRFLTDLKGAFRYESDKIEAISQALDRAAQRFPGVYQIIDRIYSLPPGEWNGYFSQLCQLLQGRMEPERFLPILEDVSMKLVA